MPITFDDGWNKLSAQVLKVEPGAPDGQQVSNIALLWLAKTRMAQEGQARLLEYLALLGASENDALTPAQRTRLRNIAKADGVKRENIGAPVPQPVTYPETGLPVRGKDGNPVTKLVQQKETEKQMFARALESRFEALRNALVRNKVTNAVLREFGIDKDKFRTGGRNLDQFLEAMHNDRLRIADVNMLAEHPGVSIRLAFRDAKNKFNGDATATALINAALADAGPAVRVTQGVHQSSNAHFDVLMPGDVKQIHCDVRILDDKRLRIHCISYIAVLGGQEVVVNAQREP